MAASDNSHFVTYLIIVIFYNSNYDLWTQEICNFIKGRLLWHIVTSEIKQPDKETFETEDKLTKRLDQWDSKNQQILTWFHNTC